MKDFMEVVISRAEIIISMDWCECFVLEVVISPASSTLSTVKEIQSFMFHPFLGLFRNFLRGKSSNKGKFFCLIQF